MFRSKLLRCAANLTGKGHMEAHRAALRDPAGFWENAARAIEWDVFPKQILKRGETADEWFSDGRLNICYNALDFHVRNGKGTDVALRYDSPVTGIQKLYTYAELLQLVESIAGMLLRQGVEKGDRVVIFMAMIPEAVATMLACARIGAVHAVCFGGFASKQLAKRILDAQPKLVVASSCGVPLPGKVVDYKILLEEAISEAGIAPERLRSVIIRRPEMPDCDLSPALNQVDFYDALSSSPDRVDPVVTSSTDPLYIMYTSGTTGKPKGVVRDCGGYATTLKWSMPNIFGVNENETMFAASDIGWVVGHSYVVYGPLLGGCQAVLYEGKPVGTPDAAAYWRVVQDHKVKSMFAAPTAMRSIKREDPAGEGAKRHDLSSFKHLFLAGEMTDLDTLNWARGSLGKPVFDHWWQTETGWPITCPCVGLQGFTECGGAGLPVPGWDVAAVDETSGEDVPPDTDVGTLLIRRPLPPAMINRLWGADASVFAEKYLTKDRKAYITGDAGYIDRDGAVHVMARTDDIINVGGVRLCTGSVEEAICLHPAVAEAVMVGQPDSLKGTVPVAFVVLRSKAEMPDPLKELNKVVSKNVGGFARLSGAYLVPRLPKTRSGKVLRGTIRSILKNEEYQMPSTIEEPAVLDEIATVLKQHHQS